MLKLYIVHVLQTKYFEVMVCQPSEYLFCYCFHHCLAQGTWPSVCWQGGKSAVNGRQQQVISGNRRGEILSNQPG